MTSVKKSRATLIGVVLAFLVPVIGAKLVLDQHWYQGAATNKGVMLVPPVELGELKQQLPEGWVIALPAPSGCQQRCQQGLYAMNQLDIALGKETDRANPVVIYAEQHPFDLSQVPVVTGVDSPELLALFNTLPSEQLFIIDPLGNIVLHYPLYADEQKMRLEAKNLLADLRKLLKLSKIG